MFDVMAPEYDQSGTPFFGPIARGLVELLAPSPGERALDLGCGRGAATFALAEAVGPSGRVDAVDLAPTMVALTAQAARERGFAHVDVRLDDASSPTVEAAAYDLVASSLVLHFMPDPADAVRRWLAAARPGGRLGVSTFRPWPESWLEVDRLVRGLGDEAHVGATTTTATLLDSDESLAAAFAAAGAVGVRTAGGVREVPFRDVAQWEHWSRFSPMRGLWEAVPPERHEQVRARMRDRFGDGAFAIEVDVRYTLGRLPD